ncbi:hypothetical protein BDZ45DRAFT_753278 [Acephala macrosclerotiorum]|nr:hypothetical protein BDZ45DRAFT_753278 [Acephala macrosclerotiorum]
MELGSLHEAPFHAAIFDLVQLLERSRRFRWALIATKSPHKFRDSCLNSNPAKSLYCVSPQPSCVTRLFLLVADATARLPYTDKLPVIFKGFKKGSAKRRRKNDDLDQQGIEPQPPIHAYPKTRDQPPEMTQVISIALRQPLSMSIAVLAIVKAMPPKLPPRFRVPTELLAASLFGFLAFQMYKCCQSDILYPGNSGRGVEQVSWKAKAGAKSWELVERYANDAWGMRFGVARSSNGILTSIPFAFWLWSPPRWLAQVQRRELDRWDAMMRGIILICINILVMDLLCRVNVPERSKSALLLIGFSVQSLGCTWSTRKNKVWGGGLKQRGKAERGP